VGGGGGGDVWGGGVRGEGGSWGGSGVGGFVGDVGGGGGVGVGVGGCVTFLENIADFRAPNLCGCVFFGGRFPDESKPKK